MARVPSHQKLFKVYSPEGEERLETLPNARDLVNGSGFSWDPDGNTGPASHAPKTVRKQVPPVSAAQEVLDATGGKQQTLTPEVVDEPEEDVDPEIDADTDE